MKTGIYKAQISSPFGIWLFAVESTEFDARGDLLTAVVSAMNCHFGLIRIKKIHRSNRRIIAAMTPVKKAQYYGKHWAWMKRLSD